MHGKKSEVLDNKLKKLSRAQETQNRLRRLHITYRDKLRSLEGKQVQVIQGDHFNLKGILKKGEWYADFWHVQGSQINTSFIIQKIQSIEENVITLKNEVK